MGRSPIVIFQLFNVDSVNKECIRIELAESTWSLNGSTLNIIFPNQPDPFNATFLELNSTTFKMQYVGKQTDNSGNEIETTNIETFKKI